MDNKIHVPVFVHNKVAMAPPDARIVCGNSDYVIDFHFDADWDGIEEKIALFTFKRNNCPDSAKVEFTGTSVEVPVLHGIKQVQVGVYAGNLQTTTGAKIPCDLSILDTAPEDGEVSPTEAARLQAQIDEITPITVAGKPTETTAGAIAQLYMDTDTGDLYKCTAENRGSYTWAPVDKRCVSTVNGVSPDENGNVEIQTLPNDVEQISMLINTDLLPAVHDADGAILTDENGNVILRY